MSDEECVRFLQWALPRLGLRWEGFRRVRRQVCRRVARRVRELGLADLAAYRAYLDADSDEWAALDAACRVTISRFYRDRGVFAFVASEVLPALAQGRDALRVWSAGCASGEEPYTVVLAWELGLARRFPGVELRVLATDVDPVLLERAQAACYGPGSVKELPASWRRRAFVERKGELCLRPRYRTCVSFACLDLREGAPPGAFDLVLCRNLVFTYYGPELRERAAGGLVSSLRVGGALVVGAHEAVPEEIAGLEPWAPAVYRRVST